MSYEHLDDAILTAIAYGKRAFYIINASVDVRRKKSTQGDTMSKLRPECGDSDRPAISDETALFLIRDSVAKRRSLIRGKLHDGKGKHCAMGAFWTDNKDAIVRAGLLEEVAAVNDSLPESATPHERWKKVNSWLRFKLKVMAQAK